MPDHRFVLPPPPDRSGADRLQLASEIHDGPLQLLMAAGQDLESSREEDQARGREMLRAAQTELRSLLERRSAPSSPGDPQRTLHAWCAAASARRPFEWSVEARDAEMDPEVEQLLLGAARELITNAAKHSRCSTLTVRLRNDEVAGGVLDVADDGVGFADATALGFGLRALVERLARRGARLERLERLGGGCRMRVTFPPQTSLATDAHVLAGGTVAHTGPLRDFGRFVALPPSRQRAQIAISDGSLLMVTSGVVLVVHRAGEHRAAELLGAGDALGVSASPGEPPPTFQVLREARLFVLQRPMAELLARWPAIGSQLVTALLARQARQEQHNCVLVRPRVEDRLMLLLGAIAERFGTVGPLGTSLGIRLTHEQLGWLVGARRPTVTMALGSLLERGSLTAGPKGAPMLLTAMGSPLQSHRDGSAAGPGNDGSSLRVAEPNLAVVS